MSEMKKCTNCGQMVSADSEYCIFCGTRIPDSAAPVSAASGTGGGSGRVRRCRNGHVFEDDSLSYCPECGLPFGDSEAPPPPVRGETWKCFCSRENPVENLFCEECGRPRAAKRSRIRESDPPPAEGIPIPEGMYTPTPDDLKPKHGARA